MPYKTKQMIKARKVEQGERKTIDFLWFFKLFYPYRFLNRNSSIRIKDLFDI